MRVGAKQLALDWAPVHVMFEQPSGVGGGLELKYMCGALMAATSSALAEHWRAPVEIRTCTSGQWKKEVVAADGYARNGTFGKPDVRHGEDPDSYPALRWARDHGYDGDSFDDADSMCIAERDRRVVCFS